VKKVSQAVLDAETRAANPENVARQAARKLRAAKAASKAKKAMKAATAAFNKIVLGAIKARIAKLKAASAAATTPKAKAVVNAALRVTKKLLKEEGIANQARLAQIKADDKYRSMRFQFVRLLALVPAKRSRAPKFNGPIVSRRAAARKLRKARWAEVKRLAAYKRALAALARVNRLHKASKAIKAAKQAAALAAAKLKKARAAVRRQRSAVRASKIAGAKKVLKTAKKAVAKARAAVKQARAALKTTLAANPRNASEVAAAKKAVRKAKKAVRKAQKAVRKARRSVKAARMSPQQRQQLAKTVRIGKSTLWAARRAARRARAAARRAERKAAALRKKAKLVAATAAARKAYLAKLAKAREAARRADAARRDAERLANMRKIAAALAAASEAARRAAALAEAKKRAAQAKKFTWATASGSDDPHFNMWDGSNHDVMIHGWFTWIQTPVLTVQVYSAYCGQADTAQPPTCIKRGVIEVRVPNTDMRVVTTTDGYIMEFNTLKRGKGDTYLEGRYRVTPGRVESTEMTIADPDLALKVHVARGTIAASLPRAGMGYGKTNGLLGFFSGDRTNAGNFKNADGSSSGITGGASRVNNPLSVAWAQTFAVGRNGNEPIDLGLSEKQNQAYWSSGAFKVNLMELVAMAKPSTDPSVIQAQEELQISAALQKSYADAGCPNKGNVCRRMDRDDCHSMEIDSQGLTHCLPAIAKMTAENKIRVRAWKLSNLSPKQIKSKLSALVNKGRKTAGKKTAKRSPVRQAKAWVFPRAKAMPLPKVVSSPKKEAYCQKLLKGIKQNYKKHFDSCIMDGDFPQMAKAIVKTVKRVTKQKKSIKAAVKKAAQRKQRLMAKCKINLGALTQKVAAKQAVKSTRRVLKAAQVKVRAHKRRLARVTKQLARTQRRLTKLLKALRRAKKTLPACKEDCGAAKKAVARLQKTIASAKARLVKRKVAVKKITAAIKKAKAVVAKRRAAHALTKTTLAKLLRARARAAATKRAARRAARAAARKARKARRAALRKAKRSARRAARKAQALQAIFKAQQAAKRASANYRKALLAQFAAAKQTESARLVLADVAVEDKADAKTSVKMALKAEAQATAVVKALEAGMRSAKKFAVTVDRQVRTRRVVRTMRLVVRRLVKTQHRAVAAVARVASVAKTVRKVSGVVRKVTQAAKKFVNKAAKRVARK